MGYLQLNIALELCRRLYGYECFVYAANVHKSQFDAGYSAGSSMGFFVFYTATKMHASTFSYHVSRPYPYKWLTPIVIIGGLLATVVITMVNVATNGYEMISTTTNDLNATLAQTTWFHTWPSFFSGSTQPKCDPSLISSGSAVATNKTMSPFTYKVAFLAQDEILRSSISSMPYSQNPLQHCQVAGLTIDIAQNRNQASGLGVWSVISRLSARCVIDIPDYPLHVNFDTVHNPGAVCGFSPSPVVPFDNNMDWATTLLIGAYQQVRANLTTYWSNGVQGLGPGFGSNASIYLFYKGYRNQSTRDPLFLDFFDVYCGTLDSDPIPSSITSFIPCGVNGSDFADRSSFEMWSQSNSSTIAKLAGALDVLGKMLWYTTLTDLGQDISSNILTNKTLSDRFATLAPVSITRENGSHYHFTAFNESPSRTVTPSVISSIYVCQVPKIKSAGTLLLSVLIADLVFLQALWKLFTLLVDYGMIRRQPEMRMCDGCQQKCRCTCGGIKCYKQPS